MRLMFRFGLRENQDVIDVDNNKLPDIRMKNRILHSLKGRRSIRETFNQNLKLEMTKGCTERRLRPILFRNQNLMVPQCQVQNVKYALPDTASNRSTIRGIVQRVLTVIELSAR